MRDGSVQHGPDSRAGEQQVALQKHVDLEQTIEVIVQRQHAVEIRTHALETQYQQLANASQLLVESWTALRESQQVLEQQQTELQERLDRFSQRQTALMSKMVTFLRKLNILEMSVVKLLRGSHEIRKRNPVANQSQVVISNSPPDDHDDRPRAKLGFEEFTAHNVDAKAQLTSTDSQDQFLEGLMRFTRKKRRWFS